MTLKEKFRKRTREEIETSALAGDNTGGYKHFLPWIVYMRTWFILYTLISWGGLTYVIIMEDMWHPFFLMPTLLPIVIFPMLYKFDYKKKGGGKK